MNAVSITMVKRMDAHLLQGYALRLTAAVVLFSWTGWQALLVSGADHMQGNTTPAALFFEAGLALLLFSLLMLLQLTRKEALPAREAVQLLFGVLLAVLPLLTWSVWWHIKLLLADHHRHHAGNVGSSSLLFACIMISIAYLATILVWLQTSVSSYGDARRGSWPHRTMNWLHACVIHPYFK